MSRKFVNTTDVLTVASAVLTAAPITMACWFRSTDNTNNQFLMALGVSGSADNNFSLQAKGAVAGDPLRASARTTSAADADSTAAYSINTWQHGCGIFAGSTARRVFLNGGNKGTNATLKVPAGLNHSRIGLHIDGTTPFKGRIAEAAIWNVALIDAEVAALAGGVCPLLIRPTNLKFYAPLLGVGSPEPDYTAGVRHLTVTGAVQAPHAPAKTIRFFDAQPRGGNVSSPPPPPPPSSSVDKALLLGVG